MLRAQNAPLISNPYAKSMNEEIPEETKAALIAEGCSPHRKRFTIEDLPGYTAEEVTKTNAYYETQTDWWIVPREGVFHWTEAMTEVEL